MTSRLRNTASAPTRDETPHNYSGGRTQTGITSDIYLSVKGRKYGSWISDSGRSVGYSTSDYIQQPAYIIESILRDELGVTNINTASFDTVGNTTNGLRNGWLFARSINTIESAIDLINRICFEAHLVWSRGNDGSYKITALDTNASTPYTIEQDQMIREPRLSWTHHSFIRNIFDIGYRYDYTKELYTRSLYADPDTSTIESIGNSTAGAVGAWTLLAGADLFGTGAWGDLVCYALNDGMYYTTAITIKKYRKYKVALSHTLSTGTFKVRLAKTASVSGTVVGGFTEQTLSGASLSYEFTATEDATAYLIVYCSTFSGGANDAVEFLATPSFKNIEFLYTSFTPDESSAIEGYGGSSTASLCGVSRSRYIVKNLLKDNLRWVQDDLTARYSFKKLIEWQYAPRMLLGVLGWWGNTASSSRKPLISYEVGDQCFVDHPILDGGVSGTYVFMVQGKAIYKNERLVKLNLTQMR